MTRWQRFRSLVARDADVSIWQQLLECLRSPIASWTYVMHDDQGVDVDDHVVDALARGEQVDEIDWRYA